MPIELEKNYNPQETEPNVYRRWEESGFFNPDNLPERHKKPFSIIMPPPNVTGTLHVGHALMLVIEDIIIRFQRMLGKKTLWLPGTDHAAIATQSKVESIIYKQEKKTRYDLGREELLNRIEQYARESHDTIVQQIRRVGSSCDWSREAFTLDDKRNRAVNTAFKRMYDDGLIYRGARVVNWDPKGQTTVSDDEMLHEETDGTFYTFRYAKNFPIPISTTRPETKVGDTAVAVNPEDKRYKQYIGKEYDVDFAGTRIHIKIVGDTIADPSLGTGAVGVTPAHSVTDWDIAQRHNLPSVQVIDEQARMTEAAGSLVAGKKTVEAREIIVQWLRDNKLLEKEELIKIPVARAQRSNGIIEPLPKLQWFIAVDKEFTLKHSHLNGIPDGSTVTLKKLMRTAVESGQIKIIPEYFTKTYYHWIDNLRDWCISRQIWYGHRIPVWYRNSELFIGNEAPNDKGWTQDPDTLDTWFSSGLWTFSTLGWPDNTDDLRTYHPTDVLETAYDILFFWVARMILMTTYLLGDIPFRTVYLHGLVRDKDRQKMSKSKGNVIDPLGVIDIYGTDALRIAMIFSTAAGTDVPLAEEKIKGMKHFANKLWNIARFILTNTDTEHYGADPIPVTDADRDILTKLDAVIIHVTDNLERLAFHEAAQGLYQFIWHELADVYLEASKPQLVDDKSKENTKIILVHCLMSTLKLLHPFMPFVTEAIYSKLSRTDKQFLMIEQWPIPQTD